MSQPPVVLGLDFGGTKIAMMVCEPNGERLASSTVAAVGELGARASFDRGIEAARVLLAGAAAGRGLAAVGVSTFGIPFEDRVELAPAISGWDQLAFGRELRAAFPGTQVIMATDAKAAAQAEVRWGALADCDPAIYLNLGTGLSAAIVARHLARGESYDRAADFYVEAAGAAQLGGDAVRLLGELQKFRAVAHRHRRQGLRDRLQERLQRVL